MEITNRYVIFPDLHFPYHDEKAFRCGLEILKYVNPTGFLLLGDTVEGESVSHWKWAKKKRPPLEYQLPEINQEIKEVNKSWDELDEVLDNIMEGISLESIMQGLMCLILVAVLSMVIHMTVSEQLLLTYQEHIWHIH